MNSSEEKRLIELLIEKGLISGPAARKIEEETWASRATPTDEERRWGTIVSKLLQRGLIREDDLRPLLDRLSEEGCSAEVLPSGVLSLPEGAEVAPPSPRAPPIENWTRYEVLSFLGDGGMGQVFKAYDPRLKRFVAVKFVRGNDPNFKARLLQEAQAQAKINHENVCEIYEVGEERGVPFIAMQFIDGVTLHEARSEMTTEQKVMVVKKAAEAIHEAHRLGLIHRDLKPGNIMVERTEDGNWRPYVMDFGLAREAESPALTATGTILGTPAFLSPEQAAGRPLDRRCDVYSLGATFYDLLADRPPFDGGTVDVLVKLATQDPAPLRTMDPSIPQDLETIVMKCLEKEPQRRYESARALAEDLERYLDGDPILARRASFSYRLAKKARKHKAAVAVGAIAVAALLALGTYGVRARRAEAKRTRLAETFGQEVERATGLLERSRLLPLHDTRPEKALVMSKTAWIEQQMKALGPVSHGPGHYALARIAISLGDHARAREYLEKAWNQDGYRTPGVAHTLGLVLAKAYQQELDEAERIANKERREKRLKEVENSYRNQALEYLRKGGQAGTETGAFAEALLAFLDKDYTAAIRKFQEVTAKAPWNYNAELMEGDVYTLQGQEAENAGRYREAAAQYAKAEEALARAVQKGRSDEGTYALLARLCELQMVLQTYGTGQSPRASLEKGLAACDSALVADPESGMVYQTRAGLLGWWAEYQSEHGEDPRASISASVESAEKAAKLLPGQSKAFHALGTAFLSLAETDSAQGKDPRPALTDAIRSFERALELLPDEVRTSNNLALAYQEKGEFEMSHGVDPRPTLGKAVRGYEKTAQLMPDSPIPLNNLGIANMDIGEWELVHGLDPRAALDRSIESLKKALGVNKNMPYANNNLGVAFLDKGRYEAAHGLDPTASWNEGILSCEKAALVKADYASPYNNLGILYKSLGAQDVVLGRDPSEKLTKAAASLEKALRINAKHSGAMTTQAQVCAVSAAWDLACGRSPVSAAQNARAAARKALAIDPTQAEAWAALGGAELTVARWEAKRGSPPGAALRAAKEAFEKVLSIDPESASSQEQLGEVSRVWAEWMVHRGNGDAAALSAVVQEGLARADKALALGAAEATALKGALHCILAKSGPRAERSAQAAQAAALLDQAIGTNAFLKREYVPLLDEAKRLQRWIP